jgi:hypothetical protein
MIFSQVPSVRFSNETDFCSFAILMASRNEASIWVSSGPVRGVFSDQFTAAEASETRHGKKRDQFGHLLFCCRQKLFKLRRFQDFRNGVRHFGPINVIERT